MSGGKTLVISKPTEIKDPKSGTSDLKFENGPEMPDLDRFV